MVRYVLVVALGMWAVVADVIVERQLPEPKPIYLARVK